MCDCLVYHKVFNPTFASCTQESHTTTRHFVHNCLYFYVSDCSLGIFDAFMVSMSIYVLCVDVCEVHKT